MNPGTSHGVTLNDKPRRRAHRRLDEDVLHSAQEEVFCAPMTMAPARAGSVSDWLVHVEQRMACYAAQKPRTATLMAMAIGGLLTLSLARSLARGKRCDK